MTNSHWLWECFSIFSTTENYRYNNRISLSQCSTRKWTSHTKMSRSCQSIRTYSMDLYRTNYE